MPKLRNRVASVTGEVVVVDVCHREEKLGVVVRTRGASQADTTLEAIGTDTLVPAAQVARWRAVGTPLLLVPDGNGRVSLHGPTHVVSDLVVLDRDRDRSPNGRSPFTTRRGLPLLRVPRPGSGARLAARRSA